MSQCGEIDPLHWERMARSGRPEPGVSKSARGFATTDRAQGLLSDRTRSKEQMRRQDPWDLDTPHPSPLPQGARVSCSRGFPLDVAADAGQLLRIDRLAR